MLDQNKIAFVFPGQGSQFVGMGKDVYAACPAARTVFQTADTALGFSLSTLCFEGPEEELKLTENTQPAILTNSIALLRVIEDRLSLKPDFVAGHSLGEYTALVCADAISFEDAVRTVRQRGRFMQEAVPLGTGEMTAVIGLEQEKLQAFCNEVNHENHLVVIANINCPRQYVISGHAEAVHVVMQLSQKEGAMIVPLAVSAPFHSPLMERAATNLESWLRDIPFNDLKYPLVNNAEAEIINNGDAAKVSLVRQMQASVQWERSIRRLMEAGVDTFIEIGPGKVLSGLLKRIDRSLNILNISDMASLEHALQTLNPKP
jgi:[acyl-carrier-protein] S-malonyltransferase